MVHVKINATTRGSPGKKRKVQYLRSEATIAIEPSLKMVLKRNKGKRGSIWHIRSSNVASFGSFPRVKSVMAVFTMSTREANMEAI